VGPARQRPPEEGEGARSARVGRVRAGRPAGRVPGPLAAECCFPFSVYAKFVVCLNLNRKSCTDSKIMRIFMQVL